MPPLKTCIERAMLIGMRNGATVMPDSSRREFVPHNIREFIDLAVGHFN